MGAVTAVSLIRPIGFSCVLQQLQLRWFQFHCFGIHYVSVLEAIRDVDAVFTSIYQRLIIAVSFRAPTFACICPIVSLPAYRHYVLAATAAVAICIHIQIRFHCFQGMVTHCIQVLGIP